MEFWERVPDGKARRIACIHAAHKRVNRVIEEFTAQAAHHELRQILFAAGRTSPDKRLSQQAQFGPKGE